MLQEEQFVELHPLQELPLLGIELIILLRSSLARDTNLEIALLEDAWHLGHSASSPALDIGRRSSNLLSHFRHLNSYIGIFLPRNKFN